MLDTSRIYPPDFTQLIAGILDTATKAVMHEDPVRYIEERAVAQAQEIRRVRSRLAPGRKRELAKAGSLRCELIRIKIVRDLSLQVVEAFVRLKRAEALSDLTVLPVTSYLPPLPSVANLEVEQ